MLGSIAATVVTDTVRMGGSEQSQGILKQADGAGGQLGMWARLTRESQRARILGSGFWVFEGAVPGMEDTGEKDRK